MSVRQFLITLVRSMQVPLLYLMIYSLPAAVGNIQVTELIQLSHCKDSPVQATFHNIFNLILILKTYGKYISVPLL
jgi:hypothetical protein